MSSASSPAARHAATRLRLLQATLYCVASSGLEVPVSLIADLAQVGTGTLFRHFHTKPLLLEAAFAHAVTVLRGPYEPIIAEPATLYSYWYRWWGHTASQAARHPDAFRYWCLFQHAPAHQAWAVSQERTLALFPQLPAHLCRVYQPLERPAAAPFYDAWLLSSHWTGALQFLLATFSLGSDPTPRHLLDRIYEAWWNGLGLARDLPLPG